MQVAGPIALMDCTEAYAQFSEKGVTILPAGTVYAYNWREVWQDPNRGFAASVLNGGSNIGGLMTATMRFGTTDDSSSSRCCSKC